MLWPAVRCTELIVASPKNTSYEIAPEPFGVMVTSPVLSWVILKMAEMFEAEGAEETKDVSFSSSFEHPSRMPKGSIINKKYLNSFIALV